MKHLVSKHEWKERLIGLSDRKLSVLAKQNGVSLQGIPTYQDRVEWLATQLGMPHRFWQIARGK